MKLKRRTKASVLAGEVGVLGLDRDANAPVQ